MARLLQTAQRARERWSRLVERVAGSGRRGGAWLAIAACLSLLVASEVVSERAARIALGDARLERVSGEQRMLTERLAQTALRLAEADDRSREGLVQGLEATVELWTLQHEAFRSVDAAPTAEEGLPLLEVPSWSELDALQGTLQRAALALVRVHRGTPPEPAVQDRAAQAIREQATAFESVLERWLRDLEDVNERRVERTQRTRRLLMGGAAASLVFALLGPGLSGRGRSLAAVRERLVESERRHRALVERCPNGVVVLVGGRIVYANPAAARLFRTEERGLVGSSLRDHVHPDDRAAWTAALAWVDDSGDQAPLELRIARPEDEDAEVLLEAAPLVYQGRDAVEAILVDVTSRRREESRRRALEARLRTAERLESLALMAGGVAHDFNNLLGTILANVEIAEASSAERDEALQGVRAATEAAGDLVRALLEYAGEGEVEFDEVDVGAIVSEAVRLLLPRIPPRVLLRLDVAPELPAALGDRTQLRQIAMNLLSNGIEAIGDSPGLVSVRIRAGRIDDAFLEAAEHGDDVARGPCVVLEVDDTGAGMDEATRARVFDPFFSTKFAGRGLGLAAVLGIVRRHRGAIAVESRPGRGSRFRAALPAAPPPHGTA